MRKNRETEQRIRQAFSHAAPDILDSVLSDCETQKGKVILMTEKKKRNYWLQGAVGAAVILAVLLVGAAGLGAYDSGRAVAAVVSLDVNPSIEIKVNRKERVLEVNALNEDGRAVVGDMDFEGSDLDVTVNALISSMLRGGYLSELANSILISVDSRDREAGAALQERLAREAGELLQTDSFSGAVLSQTVTADAELQKLAETYGITEGKAQLIRQLAEKLPAYSFEELVSRSINELNLLMETAGSPEQIEAVGTASDKAYIGGNKALEIAFAHAGADPAAAAGTEVELGLENGVMVYEVDFKWGGYEYDYDIDAVTGEVLKDKKEPDDDHGKSGHDGDRMTGESGQATGDGATGGNGGQASGDGAVGGNGNGGQASGSGAGTDGGQGAGTDQNAGLIGEENAAEAAMKHAGVGADSVSGLKTELDREHGRAVYEVEFWSGGYEYDYDIDAVTGEILKDQKELDDDDGKHGQAGSRMTGSGGQTSGGGAAGANGGQAAGGAADVGQGYGAAGNAVYIGEAAAKLKALSLAGLQEGDISGFEADLDHEDGRMVYELEFKSGGYEYHYEIDAVTGDKLNEKKEKDD